MSSRSSEHSMMITPPPRPSWGQEKAAKWLLLALSPRFERKRQPDPPARQAPYEQLVLGQESPWGGLAATFFPALGEARGAVLLAHPWTDRGKAYFHRRGRLEALREAGYHALTFDLGGFGGSAPSQGFLDRDVANALDWLRRRAGALPLHFWGISSGGYWAHLELARREDIAGAFFEDVASHLIQWSHRVAPMGWPCYKIFRHCLPAAYRYLDLRRHAPFLSAHATAYVSGGADLGALPVETEELARLAAGESMIVPYAEHLCSFSLARDSVLELALATFERAETAQGVAAGRRKKQIPPAADLSARQEHGERNWAVQCRVSGGLEAASLGSDKKRHLAWVE